MCYGGVTNRNGRTNKFDHVAYTNRGIALRAPRRKPEQSGDKARQGPAVREARLRAKALGHMPSPYKEYPYLPRHSPHHQSGTRNRGQDYFTPEQTRHDDHHPDEHKVTPYPTCLLPHHEPDPLEEDLARCQGLDRHPLMDHVSHSENHTKYSPS